MDGDSTVERGLGCPIFEAEILIAPDDETTCNGLTAPFMATVRTHLDRKHLKQKSESSVPKIQFLMYCKTCKTHFIDKKLYEASHVTKKCRNDRPQKRGVAAQQEQWIALSALIFGPELAQRSYDSDYTSSKYTRITLTPRIDSITRKVTTPVNDTPQPLSIVNPSISQSPNPSPPAKRLCTSCGSHSNVSVSELHAQSTLSDR